MTFDIDETIDGMVAAISGVISGDLAGVKDCIEKALAEEKEALSDIAIARINDDITDEDMEAHLEDEKVALEAALLVCKVKAKVMAQKAANAAIDVLKEAISAAL